MRWVTGAAAQQGEAFSLLIVVATLRALHSRGAAGAMGILSMCFGNGTSSTQIQPTPIGSRAGEGTLGNAETLVGMLTQAQQMELQSAFRRFDVNGNGTMCVPCPAVARASASRHLERFWCRGANPPSVISANCSPLASVVHATRPPCAAFLVCSSQ